MHRRLTIAGSLPPVSELCPPALAGPGPCPRDVAIYIARRDRSHDHPDTPRRHAFPDARDSADKTCVTHGQLAEAAHAGHKLCALFHTYLT